MLLYSQDLLELVSFFTPLRTSSRFEIAAWLSLLCYLTRSSKKTGTPMTRSMSWKRPVSLFFKLSSMIRPSCNSQKDEALGGKEIEGTGQNTPSVDDKPRRYVGIHEVVHL